MTRGPFNGVGIKTLMHNVIKNRRYYGIALSNLMSKSVLFFADRYIDIQGYITYYYKLAMTMLLLYTYKKITSKVPDIHYARIGGHSSDNARDVTLLVHSFYYLTDVHCTSSLLEWLTNNLNDENNLNNNLKDDLKDNLKDENNNIGDIEIISKNGNAFVLSLTENTLTKVTGKEVKVETLLFGDIGPVNMRLLLK